MILMISPFAIPVFPVTKLVILQILVSRYLQFLLKAHIILPIMYDLFTTCTLNFDNDVFYHSRVMHLKNVKYTKNIDLGVMSGVWLTYNIICMMMHFTGHFMCSFDFCDNSLYYSSIEI